MGCCEILMYCLTLFGDVFDLIMDWVFYDEIRSAEDGLVFGPHDETIVNATFVFCVIGTFTFILELVLNSLGSRCSKCCYFSKEKLETISAISEVMTLITLIIEDLPQIIINFAIALCREDVTNIVQIVKAASALVEVIIILIIMSVKYCIANSFEKIPKWRKWCFGLTLGFLFTILGFTVAVFYLETNFNKERIHFDSHGLEGDEADRYLLGVGVFMKQSTIQKTVNAEWLNITDIKTITRFPDKSSNVVVSVLATAQYIRMKKVSTVSGESLSCYQVTQTSTIGPLPSAQCPDSLFHAANSSYITMKLSYVQPTRKQPLGDILYNYRITDQNCTPISSPPLTLKYFKVRSEIKVSQLLTPTTDLHDVRDVWKTGRSSCMSTARERPKLSSAMLVHCVPLK